MVWELGSYSRPDRLPSAFTESSSGAAPPLAGPMAASPRCSSEQRAILPSWSAAASASFATATATAHLSGHVAVAVSLQSGAGPRGPSRATAAHLNVPSAMTPSPPMGQSTGSASARATMASPSPGTSRSGPRLLPVVHRRRLLVQRPTLLTCSSPMSVHPLLAALRGWTPSSASADVPIFTSRLRLHTG